MVLLQWSCLAIVLLYLWLRLRGETLKSEFALRFSLLTFASWIAENTCIHLYGFYSYNPEWFGFVDQVPLLIIVIWPVVIQSAMDLVTWSAERLQRTWWQVAGLVALMVLTDAALIEPIAVRAGLWQWTEPGLFEVPIIGILGWSLFTFLAVAQLRSSQSPWWILLLTPLGVHLGLLALWWGLLRHVHGAVPDMAAVVVAVVVASIMVVRGLRSRLPPPPPRLLMLRAPGASFFFVLLLLFALNDPALSAYAVCFAVPWILFVIKGLRRS